MTAMPSENTPWIVFEEHVPLLAEPSFSARVLGMLESGTEVTGKPLDSPSGEPWLEVTHRGAPAFVSLTTIHRIHPANRSAQHPLPIGREVVNRWWGLPMDYEPDDLEPVPAELTVPDGKDYLLRGEVVAALRRMLAAAAAEGVEIRTNSAYRSSSRQMMLYRNAVRRDGAAQRYSAPPGHSEHQLGTTVDLTDPAEAWAFTAEFAGTPQGLWLAKHAASHGFFRTYRDDNTAETGYIPEAWHWRYLGVSPAG